MRIQVTSQDPPRQTRHVPALIDDHGPKASPSAASAAANWSREMIGTDARTGTGMETTATDGLRPVRVTNRAGLWSTRSLVSTSAGRAGLGGQPLVPARVPQRC